jgi:hypothetical protein
MFSMQTALIILAITASSTLEGVQFRRVHLDPEGGLQEHNPRTPDGQVGEQGPEQPPPSMPR